MVEMKTEKALELMYKIICCDEQLQTLRFNQLKYRLFGKDTMWNKTQEQKSKFYISTMTTYLDKIRKVISRRRKYEWHLRTLFSKGG